MAEYASKGVAGSGLGLGIAGTALGLLNGGFFNGFGGWGGNGAAAMAGQGAYQAALSAKDAEIGQLKAEKYADKVGTEVFAKVLEISNRRDDEIKALTAKLADEAVAARERECELRGAIKLESERREAGDRNLYNYVNATFVPGKLVLDPSNICPPVMPRYNSWEAPTTPTPSA